MPANTVEPEVQNTVTPAYNKSLELVNEQSPQESIRQSNLSQS